MDLEAYKQQKAEKERQARQQQIEAIQRQAEGFRRIDEQRNEAIQFAHKERIKGTWEEVIQRNEQLSFTLLGIIAEATLRSGYIAAWHIVERLEAVGYEDPSIGSRLPCTSYDDALQQLIDDGLVEEVTDLGMRFRLKTP